MIFLALRYLLKRRRQTVLTLLGVFFGTAAYISVSGFLLGFRAYFVQELVNNSAQVHIQSRQYYRTRHELDPYFFRDPKEQVFWVNPPSGTETFRSVQNPHGWSVRLHEDPRVEAYSPNFTTPALFTMGGISATSTLIGCDPLQQMRVTTVGEYMVEGRFSDIANGGNRVILGEELIRKLGATPGQTVLVSVGTTPAQPFKIVGRFSTGNQLVDQEAYAAIRDVQMLSQQPNTVNEIAVRLKDYRLSLQAALGWAQLGPEKVESWDQQNAGIFTMFKLQDALRFTMIACIVIVASFGIYNVLNMTVNQKRKDVAILRSMGYDTFDVVSLFLSQGVLLGFVGGICGLAAGYGVCRYLQTVQITIGHGVGRPSFLHIALDWPIYAQAFVLALGSSSLASWLPARSAGRLTPIEVIRTSGG